MATPDGTVRFEISGENRTLRFGVNELCLLEDQVEAKVLDIAAEVQFGLGMKTLRAMFWAGSGDKDMTLAKAGELIDRLGIKAATAIAREAFEAAFPDAEEGNSKDEAPLVADAAG